PYFACCSANTRRAPPSTSWLATKAAKATTPATPAGHTGTPGVKYDAANPAAARIRQIMARMTRGRFFSSSAGSGTRSAVCGPPGPNRRYDSSPRDRTSAVRRGDLVTESLAQRPGWGSPDGCLPLPPLVGAGPFQPAATVGQGEWGVVRPLSEP